MLQNDNKNLETFSISLSSKKHCFLKGIVVLCGEKAVPAVFSQINFQVTRICTGLKIHSPIIYFSFIFKCIRMKERSIVTIARYAETLPYGWRFFFFFCLFSLHRRSTCDNL